MNTYDEDYYILHSSYSKTQFHLAADRKTIDRRYRYKKLDSTGAPLFFYNCFKDRDAQTGDRRQLTDVMSDGSSIVVTDKLKDELKSINVPDMQFYPAIFIDDDGVWHESYWYLNFYGNLNCWDPKNSVYEIDDLDDAEVDRYSLNYDVLSKIPEDNRLIFKMGGASKTYLFCQKRVANILISGGYTGFKLFKVPEYYEGDQYNF